MPFVEFLAWQREWDRRRIGRDNAEKRAAWRAEIEKDKQRSRERL